MKLTHFKKLKKTFIIAEIGNNHEGNLNLAKKLIVLASKAGADAVKFQTFKTNDFIKNTDKKRFGRLKKFEFSFEEFLSLKKTAKKNRILFMSTALDFKSANFLKKNTSIIKIASSDNNFFPLMKNILRSKKFLIISTGMIEIKNLNVIIEFIYNILGKKEAHKKVAFLHCVTSYPVEPKYANLKSISYLLEKTNFCIGYSDHTIGTEASLASVALGSKIIEKHFTIDKKFSNFRDHLISSDYIEFKNIVNSIRKLETMLGKKNKIIQAPEKKILKYTRRACYSSKNIEAGELITINNIKFLRSKKNKDFSSLKNILGKKTKVQIKKNKMIKKEHLLL